MSPYLLGTIEVRIGLIERWPRDILRLLFCSTQTKLNIKTVSAFFYGNTVPVELAYQLYEACGEMTRTGVKRDVCEMYEWFTTADDGCGVYLAAYYDLHKRVTLYINGPKMDQEERVDPRPRPQFGFGKLLSCPVTQKSSIM